MTSCQREVPVFCNEGDGRCLLTAMLSAMHGAAPHSLVNMRDLDYLMKREEGRTNIARAVTVFNALGYKARAFASSLERIEPEDRDTAVRSGQLHELQVPPGVIKDEISKGSMVVCAIMAGHVYSRVTNQEHAVTMTGFTDRCYRYHENGFLFAAPYGVPNKLYPISKFERGRAAHDYHTIIVRGTTPDHGALERAVLRNIRAKYQPALMTA